MTNYTEAALADARCTVNALPFGTPEWEAAMQVVRDLTARINAATDFGEYTSIDGDVFDRVTQQCAACRHETVDGGRFCAEHAAAVNELLGDRERNEENVQRAIDTLRRIEGERCPQCILCQISDAEVNS